MATENRKMTANMKNELKKKLNKIQSNLLTAEEVKKVYVKFSILVQAKTYALITKLKLIFRKIFSSNNHINNDFKHQNQR